jgi:hypothetical protein
MGRCPPSPNIIDNNIYKTDINNFFHCLTFSSTKLNSWPGLLLYLNPTHALLLNTLSHQYFKTLKLFKKYFVKTLKTYMFRSILYDHPQGRPLYLVHYHFSACLLRHLPIRYVAVCCLCLCVSGVPVCGLSGRERPDNPQTTTPDTHKHRRHTATYRIGKWRSKQPEMW